tara:strand:+ start:281 stop:1255 length:975 start_codon:yes stop_codon:yes gene_type:complete
MEKKILVFTNGEKIGDGIIKLKLLYEIKTRLPDYKLYWLTNKGKTVYSSTLKFIALKYIDKILDQADISPFFWKKISKKYELENELFDYILDTQKSVIRTIALKRIKHKKFISGSANGIFSTNKIKHTKKRQYYLNYILDLLNLIVTKNTKNEFQFPINKNLDKLITNILTKDKNYIGIAPGAGEKNKIWPLEKYIELCNYLERNNFTIVFFIGPDELYLKDRLKKLYPHSIFIEDYITGYQNIEIIMVTTNYLKLAISNDSGVSHMLSTGYCPLIKLFGPKDSKKFTPEIPNLLSISSSDYNSKNINKIPVSRVIKEIEKVLI